jgi:hypothetical protein
MKVKVIQGESNLWYSDQIGKVFSVEEELAYEGWYRLIGEYGHGSRLLKVCDVEVVSVIQRKFPFKVRCVDNDTWENTLEEGEIYTAVGDNSGVDYFIAGHVNSYKKSRFEIVEDETKNILGPQTYLPDPEEEKFYEEFYDKYAHNKYMREVKPGVWVDVYDVLRAWNVVDPCLQHLLKKALASGQRGHKDLKEDLEDILASAKRAVEMHKEWNSNS